MGALDVRPIGPGGEERAHQHLAAPIQLFPGGDGSLDTMFIREAALYYCPEHKNRAGW